ncbi:hypothetical protein IAS59_006059 [Cryptococcus gattii]
MIPQERSQRQRLNLSFNNETPAPPTPLAVILDTACSARDPVQHLPPPRLSAAPPPEIICHLQQAPTFFDNHLLIIATRLL